MAFSFSPGKEGTDEQHRHNKHTGAPHLLRCASRLRKAIRAPPACSALLCPAREPPSSLFLLRLQRACNPAKTGRCIALTPVKEHFSAGYATRVQVQANPGEFSRRSASTARWKKRSKLTHHQGILGRAGWFIAGEFEKMEGKGTLQLCFLLFFYFTGLSFCS